MRWTVHIEGGPRRVNHAAVRVDDKIYSFGGYCSSEEYRDWEPIPVHVLHTSTLRWEVVDYDKSNGQPYQRYGHTTVAYGHKVYMWGGRNNAVAYDTLLCFDTKTLKWSTPAVTGERPFAKDGHTACVIKNKMYIFGGFEYANEQYAQEVRCLNLDTMVWSRIFYKGEPPSHRDFHTAVAVGERMYIYGGRGDLHSPQISQNEIYCPQVYYLDTLTETWVTCDPTGPWPVGRRSHSAWLYGEHMYIFGGYNDNVISHFNDLHRYSIKNNSWETMCLPGKLPGRRRRQACILYEDKVYMFGGTSPCLQFYENERDNLMDNNDLHILDYAPTLRTLCMLAVIEHKLEITNLPKSIVTDIMSMSVPNRISRPFNQAG